MTAVEDKLRQRAAELLESGQVVAVIGWEKGRFSNQTTPCFIDDASQVDRLIYNRHCVNALGKYVLDYRNKGTVALCTRGCESRAVNRMIEDNQLKREDVYLLGLPCEGMVYRADESQMLKKCAECRHQAPVVYDEMRAEAAPDRTPARPLRHGRAPGEHVARDPRGRVPRHLQQVHPLLRPAATCAVLHRAKDSLRGPAACRLAGQAEQPEREPLLRADRAFHISDRCIECGECERVCPMDLPLMLINRKLIEDMNDLFGEFESGMDTNNADVLRNYKLDDVEEFM